MSLESEIQCSVLRVQTSMILDSSMVEHSAVNRVVVGSSPTRGVKDAKAFLNRREAPQPGKA